MRRILNPALVFALIVGACSQALPADVEEAPISATVQPTSTQTEVPGDGSRAVLTTTTTAAATTTSIASTTTTATPKPTTTATAVDDPSDDDKVIAGVKRCPEPRALPSETDVPVPLWVVGIHTRMTTLVQDMNILAEAAWASAPNDAGWSREEPVASAVVDVKSDLADIRAYSEAALEDAGLKWTRTGWTERVDTEGPMVEGPIWWLPEGIWSKAHYLKDQILPEFLATTGSADVVRFYLHGGASSAGPCATTKFMVEAVNGIIGDLD
jgi:hypothetical protein